MNTALFSYKVDALKPGGLLSGKPELFKKLEERDVTPLVTLNGESAFSGDAVEVNKLITDSTVRSIGKESLQEVGIIVNRLDRSVKMDEMPTPWQDSMPPIMNENALRSLVFRKHRVQNEVLKPLGLGMPTRLIDSYLDIDAFLQEHPDSFYIVKPTSGTFSKGVKRVAASEVADYISENQGFGKLIIQPAYDFSLPFPDTVKPYDASSAEDFAALNNDRSMTKELRMYGFYSPEVTATFPVARAMKDGVDNWFFVDPDSLPPELEINVKKVMGRAAQLTGSRAIYAAYDVAYGNRENTDPEYQTVELNGRMPYLLGYDKHPGIADILRTHLANQIQQVTHLKNGKIQE